MVDNTRLYEGVLAMLKKLRDNKILLGIVTTKYHYRIEQIVEKNNAMSVIDVIIGGDDVKNEKPDPEGLLTAGARGYAKMQPKSKTHMKGRGRRPSRVVGMFMGKRDARE